MRSRPVVLHVGMHKTGTTSVQTMIARNREHFTAEGLYYPEAGQVGVGDGQHNLAWELNGDERFDPEAGSLADLSDELREHQPSAVLISSEDLEYLHDKPDRLLMLRDLLGDLGYSARVVITLREPSEYLESLYYELVHQGRAGEFDTFVTEALEQRGLFSPGGIALGLLAPDRGILRCVRGPGAPCARLRPQRRGRARPQGLCRRPRNTLDRGPGLAQVQRPG